MKDITIWYKLNGETGEFEHNHISDGFDPDQTKPSWTTEYQRKCWEKAVWSPVKANLIDNAVTPINSI